MRLTKKDIETISETKYAKSVNLSVGKYFCKCVFKSYYRPPFEIAVNALIAEKIANKINLLCPRHHLVMPNHKKLDDVYLISEDLNELGEFETIGGHFLGYREDFTTLHQFWDILEDLYSNEPVLSSQIPDLMYDIVSIYLFDIFLANYDRNQENWGIININSVLKIAILDNDYIMHPKFLYFMSSMDKEPNNIDNGSKWQDIRSTAFKESNFDYDRTPYIRMDIENFLKISSSQFIALFEKFYNLLTPDFFKEVLDEVESTETISTLTGEMSLQIPRKEELIKIYEDNYAIISEEWRKFNHGRK